MKKQRNLIGLCAVALSLLVVGCGSNSATPPAREPMQFDVTIKATDNVNPDSHGKAAPIEIRIYELKNDSSFKEADYWSLHDKDKAILADDLLQRDGFILRPGAEKIFRRALNAQTTAIGVVAGYRILGKSVWRETFVIPEAPEMTWYSRMMPGKKIRLDVKIDQNSISIVERDK